MVTSSATATFTSSKLPNYPFLPRPPRITRHVSSCLLPPSGLRLLFAGGGNGRHVYPAIAIADEIRSSVPSAGILFVGTDAGMESSAVPKAGYDFASVPPTRLARPVLSPENLLLPFALVRSVLASWRIIREFRPQVVVGTGGHVAAPVCVAAVLAGVKIVIQEQNAYPGLSNRIMARYAAKVFLAFNACVKFFPKEKCAVYGNPVRLSLRRYVSKAVARSHFFPRAMKVVDVKVLLVLGGATDAQAINMAVRNMYYDVLSEHKNWFIIWQTGLDGYNEMESLVKNHRRLHLTPFLHAMDLAYAAADIVISRAGAMTCTEILTTGKPSILIPSTKATEDHQTFNAYIMEDIAGSKVITEEELDACSLHIAINEVLGNEDLMADMSEKMLRFARPNAAADIAQNILSIVEVPSSK
ncbi:putative UDP-N-acetylglucosamine--N-acetylmuramyl-(pentapeptide) pyrophosphoryl-undecaprenol N-acetylglucosamine transferase [Iris pallida]|uniref:UDP-N-acetylglucosamine--N-acetylmuramyl-(Pentapeptide) pyrophosphoryl-undecaprenol N-acetylglucosamine transferase n=1 Tax=Iris pallida TaxID=29817 RepID=A0AAX6F5H7_IRIPA|nr:putative UDP-N-acetylglucosamine--N-acetylmuramyl-(pentapeptide) pyrophosphoryl-undecaprenol N-acetylglucosamine transferase [Iris pallida]